MSSIWNNSCPHCKQRSVLRTSVLSVFCRKLQILQFFAAKCRIWQVVIRTVWRNEHFTLINAPTDKKTVFMMMSLFEQEPVRKIGPITTVKMGRTEFKQKSRNKIYRNDIDNNTVGLTNGTLYKFCWLLYESLKTGCQCWRSKILQTQQAGPFCFWHNFKRMFS